MKGKLRNITQIQFVRNVMIVASGTVAAQAITMAASPIITRLYGPEAFGILGLFMAIVAMIGPISALTYPVAIVLPKSDSEARGIALLSIIITLILSLLSFFIIVTFNSSLINTFNLESISSYLLFIPLIILFSGSLQICEQWLIRNKQFRVTAKVTFLQATMVQGGKVGFGLFFPKALILVIITVFSQFIKAFMLMLGAQKNSITKDVFKELGNIKSLMKKYKDFPLYRSPEVFLNSLSQSLPIVILTSLFGPASAGFYTIGRTVLNIPSQLIGKAIGDVFYPRLSEAAQNKENLSNLLKKSTLLMAGIGLVPFGIVIALGPSLFSFVFGLEWEVAGEYARWIALWSFFGFINRPSVMALPVLSAQAFHLRFTIIMLIVRVIALFIGYYVFGTDTMTVALFSISGGILNLILITLTIKRCMSFDEKNK